MNKDIKDIIQSFDLMLSDNKSVVNEVALISPLNQTSVNSKFGPRWGRLHNGVDLAANAIEVKSPADGVVEVGAIKNDSCGGTIIISHAGGFKTGFCHMQKITVKPGENVKQGDVIGISGGGKGDIGRGRSDGRHLHFTLRKDGKIVDPMDYINKTGVIMTGEVPKVTSTNDDASDSTDTTTTGTTTTKTKKSSDDDFGVEKIKNSTDIMVKKAREMAAQFGLTEEKIYGSFDLILNENKIFIDEVSATSSSLFGGSSVKIPTDGAHKGQSGWQSNNAWDIPTPIGSPVYAVADGVVVTFTDYGPTPIRKNNKTLFGAGFTVDSSNGLPDVYYTHLKDCKVNKGDSIKCGDLLGYVMDFPGSSYDHLHIGVESGHNIKEFLNADGTLKCGGRISGDVSEPIQSTPHNDDTSDTTSGTTASKTKKSSDDDFGVEKIKNSTDIMVKKAREMAAQFGLTEEKIYGSFGDRISDRFGSIIIPARSNSKIKSPVNGIIYLGHADSNCKNQVAIEHNIEGRRYFLQFCNITELNVKNGRSISKGESLGKMSDDVKVSLFDSGWGKKNLLSMMDREINSNVKSTVKYKKNNKDKDDNSKDKDKKKDKEQRKYYDPAIPYFIKKVNDMIPSITKNKKGEEPKISNFFNKYGMTTEKVNENIERIKKLL